MIANGYTGIASAINCTTVHRYAEHSQQNDTTIRPHATARKHDKFIASDSTCNPEKDTEEGYFGVWFLSPPERVSQSTYIASKRKHCVTTPLSLSWNTFVFEYAFHFPTKTELKPSLLQQGTQTTTRSLHNMTLVTTNVFTQFENDTRSFE